MTARRTPIRGGAALALCLLLSLAAPGAAEAQSRASEAPAVQPEPPGHALPLPFVGADGLGQKRLRLSQVTDRLGPPDAVVPITFDAPSRSGVGVQWLYRDRGLTLIVRGGDPRDGDARVAWLRVSAPFDGRTPQGLFLGMPQDRALEVIEATYEVRQRILYGPPVDGMDVLAGNRGLLRTQRLIFVFREGRLQRMDFQLKPVLLETKPNDDKLIGALLAGALVFAVFTVVDVVRRRLGPRWAQVQLVAGCGLLLVGAVLLFSAMEVFVDRGHLILGGILLSMGLTATVAGGALVHRALRDPDGRTAAVARRAR